MIHSTLGPLIGILLEVKGNIFGDLKFGIFDIAQHLLLIIYHDD